MSIKVVIYHNGVGCDISGICIDSVKIWYCKSGAAGMAEFYVGRDLQESVFGFYEGDRVEISYEGINMFLGYIFTKSRRKDEIIRVKAYDQLRYLKNRDTYIYGGVSAGGLIKLIGEDYRLRLGEIEDSGYILPDRIECNKTLFDIILTAVEAEKAATGKDCILYDDFGRLCYKNVENMTLPLLAKESMNGLIDFSYETTIDRDVYNSVKLFYNRESNLSYKAEDAECIEKWGVLQYSDILTRQEQAAGEFKEFAEKIIKEKSRLNKSITIKDLGDARVRAGSRIWAEIKEIGEVRAAVVKEAVHTFTNGLHTMDLRLEIN